MTRREWGGAEEKGKVVDTVCESPAVNYETVIRFKSTLKRVAQDLLDFAYSRDENYRDMIKVFLARLKCR